MTLSLLICLILLTGFYNQILPQQIFKNSIKKYQIVLSKNEKNYFDLVVSLQKKPLLKKTYPLIKLYFYNLDAQPEDEMIIVAGSVYNQDTVNTLFVYTFEDRFKFCDSIYLGSLLPEFYQFDFEGNYFIKIYDPEIVKTFPSTRPELPFNFYYLKDCILEFDNEYSFEEFEAEINYLVEEIYNLKKNLDCADVEAKNDFQRLLACLYIDLFNSGKSFDFENFIYKNYPCDDKESLLKKINSIFEAKE